MKRIIQSLKYIVLFLVIVFSGLYLYSKFHFMPTYKGQIKLSGLSATTDVFYDDYGIPHISSTSNRADLYKTFGYTVMQDRFFQIQMQKMIGSGRLSEWFGNKTIETDKTIRAIGIKHYMTKWYAKNKTKLNPELVSDLEAWLAGVNACVQACPKPIEMVLLGMKPEPVTVEDVLAFSGIMSFSFSKAYFSDAVITKLSTQISDAELSELVGSSPKDQKEAQTAQLDFKSLIELDPESFIPSLDGSQSWVISPEKSASGYATLANDPHISFSNPSVWYEAHLRAPGFELYGHFVPIIPFALIGHNRDKAWSLTMSTSDEIDLLLDPDQSHYTNRTEKILVKNEAAIEMEIQDTQFGPVINQLLKGNQNAIMAWHYFRDDNFAIEAFYDLAHAKTIDQFYPAIRKGRAPGLNVSWADKEGNIAWRILGYFPKRSEPFWKIHTVSLKEMNAHHNMSLAVNDEVVPQIQNPKQGYILSANQKPPFDYDETLISGYWEPSERFNALKLVLDSAPKIDLEMQKKMFLNNNFFGSAQRLKEMLEYIKTGDHIKKTLQAWDSQATVENKAQGFYHIWIDNIMKLVLEKKLSPTEHEQFCSTSNYWKFATRIVDNPKSAWWNGAYQIILQSSFDQTLAYFQKSFGGTASWSWGQIHQVEFEHPLGKVKPLNYFFNIGPFPVDGGYMVPNAYRHKLCTGAFQVTGGASTRRLIDFKNVEDSVGILPTGNSGVPFSKHYSDQVELYLKGDFRAQIIQWERIEKFPDHVEFVNQ
jgi:penicillin G amidase